MTARLLHEQDSSHRHSSHGAMTLALRRSGQATNPAGGWRRYWPAAVFLAAVAALVAWCLTTTDRSAAPATLVAPTTPVAPSGPAALGEVADHPRKSAPSAAHDEATMAGLGAAAGPGFNEAEWDAFARVRLRAEKLQEERRQRYDGLALAAAELDTGAAQELEERLTAEPGDVEARVRLLGYYAAHPRGAGAWDRRNAHLLWLVEHRPELPIAGSAWANLVKGDDPVTYDQVERLWTLHLDADPADPDIVLNAALFFVPTDPGLAQSLLAKAEFLLAERS
ncbi:MAG: hypothetical protein HYV63_15285 [Candidatus Schekmanbacteria bacterium]|nr:hypothetical protein [Candidatus Schekmanbacteria bacterium]